jgi:hypothetical protein
MSNPRQHTAPPQACNAAMTSCSPGTDGLTAAERVEHAAAQAARRRPLRLLDQSNRLLERVRENAVRSGRQLRRAQVLIGETQIRLDRADRR